MHRMEGRVLHQVPEWHGAFRAAADGELDVTAQVSIPETGQEGPEVLFDPRPHSYQRFDLREILGIQALASLRTATAIQPSPLGAQDVDQGVPDGTVAPRDGLRELLGRQLRNDAKQLPGSPVVIVVEAFEIVDAHLRSPVRVQWTPAETRNRSSEFPVPRPARDLHRPVLARGPTRPRRAPHRPAGAERITESRRQPLSRTAEAALRM
jgi:hypothetical protein